jgi:hypothetical protein
MTELRAGSRGRQDRTRPRRASRQVGPSARRSRHDAGRRTAQSELRRRAGRAVARQISVCGGPARRGSLGAPRL